MLQKAERCAEKHRVRMIDLGDLTWNKEHDLACPTTSSVPSTCT